MRSLDRSPVGELGLTSLGAPGLHQCILRGDFDRAVGLIRDGADPNERINGITSLMAALLHDGRIEVEEEHVRRVCQFIRAIVALGASVDERDEHGMTALRHSIDSWGGAKIAETLLECGASLLAASGETGAQVLALADEPVRKVLWANRARFVRSGDFRIHEVCGLKIEDHWSHIDVRFCLPKDLSGRDIQNLFRRDNPFSGRPVSDEDLCHLLSVRSVVRDTSFRFVVCWDERDSFLRHNSFPSPYNGILKNRGLRLGGQWAPLVATLLFRDEKGGFPKDLAAIGSLQDEGDLFRGRILRATHRAFGASDNIDGIRTYGLQMTEYFVDILDKGPMEAMPVLVAERLEDSMNGEFDAQIDGPPHTGKAERSHMLIGLVR